ncbi:uncharacterized protein BJ171DRAFT_639964 [Polychytrium aggregatum]|uniref:uncharacterized protein n=1 Tax=Polychytrium aggregatum TaxID=110093 RepID=UPI0022FEE0D0|nr:uncharacterized protein BJ171DRAFT_639964 [Polychytrium aggregatum]KAI9207222.1 hypothetical protein BJ171DRAFT_639964 [Polychytrium aggregatum]
MDSVEGLDQLSTIMAPSVTAIIQPGEAAAPPDRLSAKGRSLARRLAWSAGVAFVDWVVAVVAGGSVTEELGCVVSTLLLADAGAVLELVGEGTETTKLGCVVKVVVEIVRAEVVEPSGGRPGILAAVTIKRPDDSIMAARKSSVFVTTMVYFCPKCRQGFVDMHDLVEHRQRVCECPLELRICDCGKAHRTQTDTEQVAFDTEHSDFDHYWLSLRYRYRWENIPPHTLLAPSSQLGGDRCVPETSSGDAVPPLPQMSQDPKLIWSDPSVTEHDSTWFSGLCRSSKELFQVGSCLVEMQVLDERRSGSSSLSDREYDTPDSRRLLSLVLLEAKSSGIVASEDECYYILYGALMPQRNSVHLSAGLIAGALCLVQSGECLSSQICLRRCSLGMLDGARCCRPAFATMRRFSTFSGMSHGKLRRSNSYSDSASIPPDTHIHNISATFAGHRPEPAIRTTDESWETTPSAHCISALLIPKPALWLADRFVPMVLVVKSPSPRTPPCSHLIRLSDCWNKNQSSARGALILHELTVQSPLCHEWTVSASKRIRSVTSQSGTESCAPTKKLRLLVGDKSPVQIPAHKPQHGGSWPGFFVRYRTGRTSATSVRSPQSRYYLSLL